MLDSLHGSRACGSTPRTQGGQEALGVQPPRPPRKPGPTSADTSDPELLTWTRAPGGRGPVIPSLLGALGFLPPTPHSPSALCPGLPEIKQTSNFSAVPCPDPPLLIFLPFCQVCVKKGEMRHNRSWPARLATSWEGSWGQAASGQLRGRRAGWGAGGAAVGRVR